MTTDLTRAQESTLLSAVANGGHVYLEGPGRIATGRKLEAKGKGRLTSVITKPDGTRVMCSRIGMYFVAE